MGGDESMNNTPLPERLVGARHVKLLEQPDCDMPVQCGELLAEEVDNGVVMVCLCESHRDGGDGLVEVPVEFVVPMEDD